MGQNAVPWGSDRGRPPSVRFTAAGSHTPQSAGPRGAVSRASRGQAEIWAAPHLHDHRAPPAAPSREAAPFADAAARSCRPPPATATRRVLHLSRERRPLPGALPLPNRSSFLKGGPPHTDASTPGPRFSTAPSAHSAGAQPPPPKLRARPLAPAQPRAPASDSAHTPRLRPGPAPERRLRPGPAPFSWPPWGPPLPVLSPRGERGDSGESVSFLSFPFLFFPGVPSVSGALRTRGPVRCSGSFLRKHVRCRGRCYRK